MADHELAKSAWHTQSKVRKHLQDALPPGLGMHSGGTGNRKFLQRIDRATGYWHENKGKVRWVFHVEPNEDSPKVQFPSAPGALELPGAMNTMGPERKALLSFIAVPLVITNAGAYVYPEGWQWNVIFVLGKPVPPTNSAVKVQNLELGRSRLSADQSVLPIADWAVVGHLPPDTTFTPAGSDYSLTYHQVGKAFSKMLEELEDQND